MSTEFKEINDIARSLLKETEKSASNIKYLLNGFRKNVDGEIIISTESDEKLFSQVRKDLYRVTKMVRETRLKLVRSSVHTEGKIKNKNALSGNTDEKMFPHPERPIKQKLRLPEAVNVLKGANDNMIELTQRYKLPGDDDKIISDD